MGRRRCCCEGCTELFNDDFDRANSTDLGADWTEVSGDWEIKTQVLWEAGTLEALVWCNTEQDAAEIVVHVMLESTEPTVVKKYRIIILGVDESNYLYGQVESSELTYRIAVGVRAGGVDTELDEWTSTQPLSNEQLLCLAFDGANLMLIPSETMGDGVWGCADDTLGRKVGLANWYTEEIEFDDFDMYTFDKTDPNCICMCTCNEECLPHDLIATFAASGNCTAMLDGETIELSRIEGTGGYFSDYFGEKDVCTCGWCGGHLWDMKLKCGETLDEWLMLKDGPTGTSQCTATPPEWGGLEDGFNASANPTSGTCKPFSLVFGPFTVSPQPDLGNCDCCTLDDLTGPSGTYTITITEAP